MSIFAELPPLFPEKREIGARTGLILEVLSNSPIGVWRSPSGATNIHVGTSENAGAVHFRYCITLVQFTITRHHYGYRRERGYILLHACNKFSYVYFSLFS